MNFDMNMTLIEYIRCDNANHPIQSDSINRSVKAKSRRTSVFVRWLVEVFGIEYLQSHRVVDVAGGKGQIAFMLQVEYGVTCCFIDPLIRRGKAWLARVRLGWLGLGLVG